ncbi:MAG: hypothetical protein ACTSPB_13020 [Candidatus Thorarchaeota archaeon]
MPINTVIILVLATIVLVLLVIFVTSYVFREQESINEQKIFTECCNRACQDPSNFDDQTSLEAVTCVTSDGRGWNYVSYLDNDGDGSVTLWEIGLTRAASADGIQTACSC